MIPTEPLRRTVTPDACIQKATNLLFSPFPSDQEIHQAQVLVTLGRELRIAKRHRQAVYGTVDYEVTPEPPVPPQAGAGVDDGPVAGPVSEASALP